ncbi:hypothetical protein ZWY2020_043232 [Hordeum vulgare]|nr:hypothetical protein ZWY2020_043232 [Hordeum vulgare]
MRNRRLWFFGVRETLRSTSAWHRGQRNISISTRSGLWIREVARELEEDIELGAEGNLNASTPSKPPSSRPTPPGDEGDLDAALSVAHARFLATNCAEAVDRSWRDWESTATGSGRTAVRTQAGDDDFFKSGGGRRPAVRLAWICSMGIYITRWSAKRLREIANTVKGKKRDVISKSSFGDLLHISPLPPPPEALVDFIVLRIDTKKRLLKLTDRKKIPLTRDLVKKIFNVPCGSKPLEFGKRGKVDFREIYLEGERAPIPTTVSVLSNADDDDEDTIDRTWILLCLSLVLAPDTKHGASGISYALQDMSVVHEFEWDENILLDAMREIKKYQDKRNEGKLKFHIGGCLPMLPIIYMDHIDIPRGCIVDHNIDYSLPRACFVKEFDFTAVIAVDTMEDGFGKRPFSSTTPYATTKFLSYIEKLAELPNIASVSATEIPVNRDADGAQQPTKGGTNEADGRARNVHEPPPKNTKGGDDVCGSLEDWLHPLPTFEDSEDVPQVESPPRSPAVDIESFMEIRERRPKFDDLFAAATSPGPVYDVTPLARIPPISTGPAEACIDDIIEEAQVEVSSGRGHDQKHPTLQRDAPTEPTAAKLPKMKKKKIDAMDDAIYQRTRSSSSFLSSGLPASYVPDWGVRSGFHCSAWI